MALQYDYDTGEWYDDGTGYDYMDYGIGEVPVDEADTYDWGSVVEPTSGLSLSGITDWLKQAGEGLYDTIVSRFTKDGKTDWRALATAGGALYGALSGGSGSSSRPSGYQGGIPNYTAVRQAVPVDVQGRRPGSGGLRYFTDTQYVPKTGDTAAEALQAAQTAAGTQATGLAALNRENPYNAAPTPYQPPAPTQQAAPAAAQPAYNPAYSGENVLKTVQGLLGQKMAAGGVVGLQNGGFVVPADVVSHLGNGSSDAGLRHLARAGAVPIRGRGDGMSDSNPTTIGGRQPAAVAHEEAYFGPAEAAKMGGPERLYAMMDQIRKDRTGTTKQGRQINPDKYLG